MSDMVELVRLAIMDEAEQYAGRDIHERRARAAIAAMREPSAAVVEAGRQTNAADFNPIFADEQVMRIWRAMIDDAREK